MQISKNPSGYDIGKSAVFLKSLCGLPVYAGMNCHKVHTVFGMLFHHFEKFFSANIFKVFS